MKKNINNTINKNINKKKLNKNFHKKKKIIYEIYNLHIKKTLNNFFLTLTKTIKGNVLYQLSAGNCKILTKKKKKSLETLRQISFKMAEFLILNKITYIANFFISLNNPYYFKKCFKVLRKNRIFIKNIFIFKLKAHNGVRKQKLKRL